MYLAPEDGFLGLSEEETKSAQDARAVIIPFGLEQSVSYGGGTSKGPHAILEASRQVELFDEELWCEPFRQYGATTLKPVPIEPNIEQALEQISTLTQGVLEQGNFPLILGGEHSLTAGAIRPFAKRYPKLTIVQFDAHADLRDGYEGERYSHAAAMRRVLDFENISLVSIGIRNISSEEIPFLEENEKRIKIFWAKDNPYQNVDDIISAIADDPVYISFDLDGFDASLMPATGTPEPGGFFFQDICPILKELGKSRQVVGADIVELAPIPQLHSCDFVAAKLAYKILSYSLAQ